GPSMARAVLLAAEVVPGADAHRLGMVNRVGALPEAIAWAEEIISLAPLTIGGHKLMLNRQEKELGDDSDVAGAFVVAWEAEDFAEGNEAFRSRRSPRFGGR